MIITAGVLGVVVLATIVANIALKIKHVLNGSSLARAKPLTERDLVLQEISQIPELKNWQRRKILKNYEEKPIQLGYSNSTTTRQSLDENVIMEVLTPRSELTAETAAGFSRSILPPVDMH